MQPPTDHTVTKQTWQHADLQSEPILLLTDVQDVAGVCSAGSWSISTHTRGLRDELHTLTLFTIFQVLLRQPECLALLYMQVDLVADVSDNLCCLLYVSLQLPAH